jgi:hypothetical protein
MNELFDWDLEKDIKEEKLLKKITQLEEEIRTISQKYSIALREDSDDEQDYYEALIKQKIESIKKLQYEIKVLNTIVKDKYYLIADKLLVYPEIEIVYPAVRKYIDELNSKQDEYNLTNDDIIDFYEIFLNQTNEFYLKYLFNLEKFKNLNTEEQINILYSYLKDDIPDWIYDLTEYSEKTESVESEINDDKEPYDFSKIDIINQPHEIEALHKKSKRDPKELELSPDYQRNFVWNSKEKSRLIESILIGIPLPTFYFDCRNEAQWVVIDGLQRLTTIFDFIDDKFKLTNLEYLNLKGETYSTLERKYQRRIDDFQLLCNKIRPNTPSKIAFNIFQRINTLGKKLEIQELRNAMYIGKSTRLLNKLIKTTEFTDLINNKRNFKRMDDQAIILRYLAFKITNYEEYDNNNMNEFLGSAMDKINKMNDIEVRSLKNTFLDSMKKGKILFDKDPFAKPSNNKDKHNPISKTLFESIGYTLDKYTLEEIEINHIKLRNKIYELYENEEFILKTSVATNNPPNVIYRFDKFQEIFKEIIGH